MKKLLSLLTILAVTLGVVTIVGAPAEAAKAGWTMKSAFAREIVRPGDVDTNPYHIEHVYEVQYRLTWLGLLHASPDGRFGPKTKAAVLRFQKHNGLRQTGIVGYQTWRSLIIQTIRGRRAIPKVCKAAGWQACYDRLRHQVTLYHNGTLHNAWLVRGGAADTPTRSGNFTVFSRDIDHRSHEFEGAPMPYSQFFSGGEALHGSRFMVDPFTGHSHGCVNMWVEDARQLWRLTSTKHLGVHVYGAWD
jgi:lipoprotein-anchoring transpeptidase ErfK/SrfK